VRSILVVGLIGMETPFGDTQPAESGNCLIIL
jgi:hypothetical protein